MISPQDSGLGEVMKIKSINLANSFFNSFHLISFFSRLILYLHSLNPKKFLPAEAIF